MFKDVYLLHGKGGSPNGTVRTLKHAMVPLIPNGCRFMRPDLPHGRQGRPATVSVDALDFKELTFGAIVIGISLGGLVAARVQESGRPDLSVVCVSSPTWADGVLLKTRMPNRVALFSSTDSVIQGRTENWRRLAQAYDLPWLSHDTDVHIDKLAPILADFVNAGTVENEINPQNL